MPYKDGSWGVKAKARSKTRKQYYKNLYLKKRKVNNLGIRIPNDIVKSFLTECEMMCKLCKANTKLLIHHKDCNKKNNELDNLVILCRGCHNKIHKSHNPPVIV